MARNRAVIAAPPATVFAVLSDPSAYARFVVGTKRVRRFDPRWPDAGSAFHHTLGIGPFVLRDLTTVVEVEHRRRLVLRAQMRPLSVQRVTFDLRGTESGTEVDLEEYAIEGPAARVWNRALDGLTRLRNRELLRRLGEEAERRFARQAGPPGRARSQRPPPGREMETGGADSFGRRCRGQELDVEDAEA